ncbi:MAG: hypothetical protein HY293_10890 [Planctomycetes bacterium]|nr:hypothetical protein [Planctomycetota bacterium]
MDKRTRILAIGALVAVCAFVLDKAVGALVIDPLNKINLDLAKADAEIRKANTTLNTEETVRKNWNRIQDRLAEPRPPDVHTNFMSHLSDHFEKINVQFDMQENQQPQQQGDFKEYIFDTKFKLTWPQFVDLLVELHNSKEFLKPLRMNISSLYEKEDLLALELKVSTIEYSPAPVKAGLK